MYVRERDQGMYVGMGQWVVVSGFVCLCVYVLVSGCVRVVWVLVRFLLL